MKSSGCALGVAGTRHDGGVVQRHTSTDTGATATRLTSAIALAAALLVGVLTATQARVVGTYSNYNVDPLHLILANYALAITVLTLLVIVIPDLRRSARRLVPLTRQRNLRWYQLCGGMLGAWLVVSQSITVLRIGVALSIVALVSGLIVTGMVVDAAGIGPAGKRAPTPNRIVAGGLAIVAVVIDLAPELAMGTMALPVYHVLAMSAGCGVALQQALNGRVAAATGQPVISGWVNFVVGGCALGVVVVGLGAAGSATYGALPDQPWWLYTPGLLGPIFVILAAWAVRWIGVLRVGLLTVTGQLLAALTFDLLAPMVDVNTEIRIAIGVAVSLAAVILASRPGPQR